MKTLTHLSLFTGIGGLDLAAEMAGIVDEKGYLRVYKDDELVGVYDQSVLLIAHIRGKNK